MRHKTVTSEKLSDWAGFATRLPGHPVTIALTLIAGFAFLYQMENNWATVPFAAAILLAMGGLLHLVTGRWKFSFYTTWMIYGLLAIISMIKYKLKGFSLHYYDILIAGSDREMIGFLFGSFLYVILPVFVLLVIVIVAGVFFYRTEQRRTAGSVFSAAIVAVPAMMLPLTYPTEAQVEGRYAYYLYGRHSTAFFVSLLDLEFLFAENELETKLAETPPQLPFDDGFSCGGSRPDVFIVLSETQANPADFATLKNGEALAKRFETANGPLNPLNVETFGGGTWITNLSLMTGLPSAQFGWRSPYLTIELQDKVHGALPALFAKCGYRTVSQLALNYSFVNEGPFLNSIGFEDVFDRDAIGAADYHLRDKFYFDAAEKIIAEHRKNDGRPLFMVMQTMFPHSPYEERLEPQIAVSGEPLDDNPEIAEYLRRMVIARQDLGAFFDRRAAEAGPRGAVLMDYGDHQSFVTKPLVEAEAGEEALGQPGSMAYRTFYTMRRIGPDGAHVARDNEPVDIALLGSRLLTFADLPANALWNDLARVDNACRGSLHDCAAIDLFDRHQRRRVDSGLLDLIGGAGEVAMASAAELFGETKAELRRGF